MISDHIKDFLLWYFITHGRTWYMTDDDVDNFSDKDRRLFMECISSKLIIWRDKNDIDDYTNSLSDDGMKVIQCETT